MKDCPVCGKVGLADDVQACPQCNADLECFDLLDSLHEEAVEPDRFDAGLAWIKELEDIRASLNGIHETLGRPQKSDWMRTYAMAALFALSFAALMLLLYRDFASARRVDDRISRLELQTSPFDAGLKAQDLSGLIAKMEAITQRLRAMENGLSDLLGNKEAASGRFPATLEHLNKISERLVSLEERLSDLTAQPSPSTDETGRPSSLAREDKFLYHEPRKGETLWSIARRYYGSGRFYPVLLEHNPGLGIYFDRGYGRIRILKDRQRAKEVLGEVVLTQGNRILFRYEVVEGDTWERISTRFFGQASKAAELSTLNPPGGSVAGGRVFVPLR